MAHNYAKPLTAEARLARVLERLPKEWSITLDRPGDGLWSAQAVRPDGAVVRAEPLPTLAEALEVLWRAGRDQ